VPAVRRSQADAMPRSTCGLHGRARRPERHLGCGYCRWQRVRAFLLAVLLLALTGSPPEAGAEQSAAATKCQVKVLARMLAASRSATSRARTSRRCWCVPAWRAIAHGSAVCGGVLGLSALRLPPPSCECCRGRLHVGRIASQSAAARRPRAAPSRWRLMRTRSGATPWSSFGTALPRISTRASLAA
jgi:hypothetical protein